jgi:diadenosine tetraphosphate (Ap4A) HIT family hydrolase
MADGFTLHPRLEKDTGSVGDLPLSRVLVMNDANFPWLILVPRRAKVSEIIDLADHEQATLMIEIGCVATALKALTGCEKLNIAAIGNIVPQLHVHVVARRRGDVAWPKPVWGNSPPLDYDPRALAGFIERVRDAIGLD